LGFRFGFGICFFGFGICLFFVWVWYSFFFGFFFFGLGWVRACFFGDFGFGICFFFWFGFGIRFLWGFLGLGRDPDQNPKMKSFGVKRLALNPATYQCAPRTAAPCAPSPIPCNKTNVNHVSVFS
jgi:hypothetical protein